MNYLDTYRSGGCEQAWSELQALGDAVRREPCYPDAWDVAVETMRRVRRNCERLVTRLREAGYVFGVYPDGSRGYYTEGPLVTPSDASRLHAAELRRRVGPLPLSLEAFWQEVGSVDFVGMHPAWPTGLDALVVNPPAGPLANLDADEPDASGSGRFVADLAPDVLHKDNVSGGASYAIALPDASADAVLLNERNNLLFVSYLRMAILQWGGFPGLATQDVPFEALNELVAGLEPF